MDRKRTVKQGKEVAALTHDEATRTNIPSAEHQSVLTQEQARPVSVRFERGAGGLDREKEARDRDLDPQLVWRGKDQADWHELVVAAPPLYIQEKVHPKVLIDDLRRQTQEAEDAASEQPSLFADFGGFPEGAERTDFYQHEGRWQNRMILGDSLAVMASLAEREGLRGKVQCIYIDPPYGIKFNSNFQWSTTSRDVKDGNAAHITREPEQVKAFRDTWRDGIHSYLTYLRDRLTVARDLLTESGSIFVQIGDENVHRVRAVMDEVFGDRNFVVQIVYKTNSPLGEDNLPSNSNFLLWYARDKSLLRSNKLFEPKGVGDGTLFNYVERDDGVRRSLTRDEKENPDLIPGNERPYFLNVLLSGGYTPTCTYAFDFLGQNIPANKKSWRTNLTGMNRLIRANRLTMPGRLPYLVGYHDDFAVKELTATWSDTRSAMNKIYVVQTQELVVDRCILMATNPGDLVLDPTCGGGTTAFVAEHRGRRWITIDTSRVALALARSRLMGARYPYYLLADSVEGQRQEAKLSHTAPSTRPTQGDLRLGFVYERVPHVTLKAIANNTELDVIYDRAEQEIGPLRKQLTRALPVGWLASYRSEQKYTVQVSEAIQEWEVPREPPEDWGATAQDLVREFWRLRIARQRDIDASIAAKAEFEYLFDKPYEDRNTVRVAGPFTVESLSPHRMVGVDEEGDRLDPADKVHEDQDAFVRMVLENLEAAGVQQAAKSDRIEFKSLVPWPGFFLCAEGRYLEGGKEKRAGIFVGPEFGTVTRPDLVDAAKEAGDAGFDVVIACAFNYDAHATEFTRLGAVPVLKARMNADLHMATDLKTTGKGNLFVVFGEPDIEVRPVGDDQLEVEIRGIDVFDPSTGEVRADDPDGIALWMIDTQYDGESFFVRHAYFLGANDPYKALRTTLKAEIDEDAWASLNSAVSRPFPKPSTGRIAVKAINHLGDEVMKVFRV